MVEEQPTSMQGAPKSCAGEYVNQRGDDQYPEERGTYKKWRKRLPVVVPPIET